MTPIIGNTYSGSSMIGLAATLDIAKPGQKIMVTSFGSGAGSDSFAIEVTENIDAKRKDLDPVRDIMRGTRHTLTIQLTSRTEEQ
jgi:hydroxymethylglutaryl-CoA synthase